MRGEHFDAGVVQGDALVEPVPVLCLATTTPVDLRVRRPQSFTERCLRACCMPVLSSPAGPCAKRLGTQNAFVLSQIGTVAVHPVVVRHAATGEPGIYVNPYTTSRILGLSDEESEALLRALTDQIESEAFRWEHVWSVGDTLMWDNRGGLMHAGRMDYPRDQARRFIRTTVRGGTLASYQGPG